MDDPSHPSPKYLRPKDVVARYRISIATVYRLLKAEKISGISKDGITLVEVEIAGSLSADLEAARKARGEVMVSNSNYLAEQSE